MALPNSYSKTHKQRGSPYLWVSVMHHQAQAQPPYTYCFTSEPQQPPAESRDVGITHGRFALSQGKSCPRTESQAEQLHCSSLRVLQKGHPGGSVVSPAPRSRGSTSARPRYSNQCYQAELCDMTRKNPRLLPVSDK